MSYFISITAIFMAVFALKFFTKYKSEILFPIVNLSIIVLLYFFGMCQLLLIGGYIIMLAIVIMFIWATVKIIKQSNKEFVKQFFSPSFIIILTFAIVQYFALRNMRVISHDELTHWGLVVKNMFYHHNFGGGATATTMFKGYPVGSSLFLYFFEMFGLSFIDSHLYMAMNLLNLSLLLPIASRFNNEKQKITTSLIIIGVAFLFNHKMFYSIWNDQFLSISMAFILISYFCFVQDDGVPKINFIAMLLATFVLISSKSTGLVLAIFAYLIIGLDILINRKHLLKKNYKKTILNCCLVLITILTPKISWSIYLKFIQVGGAWQTNELTLSNILNYFFKPNSFQSQVTKNYMLTLIYPFKNKGNAGSLPLPMVLEVLIIFILILMIKKKKSNHNESISLSIGIFLTLFAYLIGLLISYIFTFEQGEALAVQSLVRYCNTYTLGIILFLVSYYILQFNKWNSNKHTYTYVGTIISIIVIVASISGTFITQMIHNRTYQFKQFESYVSHLNTNDRVYIINESEDTVKDYLQMRFIATPIDTSGLKIGGSPHIGDIWNKSMTADQFAYAIIVGNYNYLYIHNTSDSSLQQYETMFSSLIKPKTIYAITNNNGLLSFKEIPLSTIQ